MRSLLQLIFIAMLTTLSTGVGAETPVASVPVLDINRYVGKWFEIASFPMFFQRNCIGDTTAEYALTHGGKISVLNRCRTKDGVSQAEGKAFVVDGSKPARLKVSFFWPFRSDYWVIGLDPDYRWAIVANPNRKYLWILSRTRLLPRDQLDAALAVATAQGYDLSQLRYTPQGEGNPSD